MSAEKGKRKRAASLPPNSSNGDGDGEAAGADAGAGAGADDQLFFKGITAYFVETGVQPRRLQCHVFCTEELMHLGLGTLTLVDSDNKVLEVEFKGFVLDKSNMGVKIWKQKVQQLGGVLEKHYSKHLSHVFAPTVEALTANLGSVKWGKRKQSVVKYTWIEDCLKAGKCLPIETYDFEFPSETDPPSQTSTEDADLQIPLQEDQGASPSQAKTSDWMQIIKEGGKIGVFSSTKGSHKKEGGLHDSQGESMEKESNMKDAGLGEVRDALDYSPPDLNSHITGPFSEMRDIYKEAIGDARRAFSYAKALSVLEKVPFKITNVIQVKGLPTIGKSLIDSIQEILSTGKFSKLENLKNDEKVKVIYLFGSVWGIGPTTAQKLYDKGYRSLEDLQNESSLSAPQRIGLKFHEDIIQRIPRHEIAEMDAIVQKAGAELCPGISIVCGGSYRRGKATSGDMDFIITHSDGHSHTGFMHKLISKLKEENFLTEDLRLSLDHSTEGTDHGVDTYFGLCKYPGRVQRHRIDIKVYPIDQYPFGIIQWTGNDVLNRRLRILAEKMGYRLDDHGLYPVISDGDGGKVKSPVSVPLKSEREVFEKLGFPWLEPHQRNL